VRRPAGGFGLLLELAPRDRHEVLVAVDLALRNRPVTRVAVREERPARVPEQDLEPAAPRPEEEDAGADSHCHVALQIRGPAIGLQARAIRADGSVNAAAATMRATAK
jgi:hypothetical protein